VQRVARARGKARLAPDGLVAREIQCARGAQVCCCITRSLVLRIAQGISLLLLFCSTTQSGSYRILISCAGWPSPGVCRCSIVQCSPLPTPHACEPEHTACSLMSQELSAKPLNPASAPRLNGRSPLATARLRAPSRADVCTSRPETSLCAPCITIASFQPFTTASGDAQPSSRTRHVLSTAFVS